MPIPMRGDCRSYDLGIVVNRGYVDDVKDVVDPRIFERNFQRDISELRAVLPNDFKFDADLWKDNLPWLWSFDGRGWGFQVDREALDSIDFDSSEEIMYSSHNCDSLNQRGLIISAFGIWAEHVQRLCVDD